MMTAPQDEEPGFETDVNELSDGNNGPEDTLEDKAIADEQKPDNLEELRRKEPRSEKRAAYTE